MTSLVERALDGELGAFEELYEDNVGHVYALCMRMVGDPAAAEELTQASFVRAWEKLDTFRGDAAFSTWLHRLTVNLVLSHRRSKGRERARFVPTDDYSIFPTQARTRSKPQGLGMDLEEAIAELPPGAREVFVLYEIEGYRHREVAEALEIATGTSKAQLHRARRLLRESLTR